MKKLLPLSLICLMSINSFSQDYFVTSRKDTVYVEKITNHYKGKIKYRDTNGEKQSMAGTIKTIHKDSTTWDLITTKKEGKGKKFAKRIVSGKAKVYLYDDTFTMRRSLTWSSEGKLVSPDDSESVGPKTTTMAYFKVYVKMPNGYIYDATKSSVRKKKIQPYLLRCTAFKNLKEDNDLVKLGGAFAHPMKKLEKVATVIENYNSVCN